MGNCLRRESTSMQLGGDDWASPALEEEEAEQPFFPTNHMEENSSCSPSSTINTKSPPTTTKTKTTTEVKIKVTKKQLEKLLSKVNLKEMSVQQVLAHLITIGGEFRSPEDQPTSWRPALQTIPE